MAKWIAASSTSQNRYEIVRTIHMRDFEGTKERLFGSLFKRSAEDDLEKEFRLPHFIFEKLMRDLANYSPVWTRQTNMFGRDGIHPEVKVLLSLKVLADGGSPEGVAREFGMCANSARRFFYMFCEDVVNLYEEKLISSTLKDKEKVEALLEKHKKVHGVSGLVGSIDCVHVYWHACPTALQGSYKSRFKHPTLVTEAVCDCDLKFSHVYSGLPGTLNDITILRQSPLVSLFEQNSFPRVEFEINKEPFNVPYFYGDGAYPNWSTFLTAPRNPETEEEKAFTKKQESARKDIERAFGVLKKRFVILKNGLRVRDVVKATNIIRCCFVLHNILVDYYKFHGGSIFGNLSEEEQLQEEEENVSVEETVEEPTEDDGLWYFSRTENFRLRQAVYKAFGSKNKNLR